jgi:hypothetical protein
MKTDLKITYGCYPSIFSTLIANILVQKGLNIKYILVSTKKIVIEKKQINSLSGLLFIFKRFTIKFIVYQLYLVLFVPYILKMLFFIKGFKFYSLKKLCQKNQIQYIESENFSLDVDKISDTNLFLSMCLNQIINDQFFSKISHGCVNIHPSDLPDFRGVDPIIHFLLSPEKKMGITMHKMTAQIDDGDILAKSYVIRDSQSHFSLMKTFVAHGVDLFFEYVKNDLKYTMSNTNPIKVRYPYKSWPTKFDLISFQRNNKYIKWSDLWNWDEFLKIWRYKK